MTNVAPARERGLKFILSRRNHSPPTVAPARERGLKSRQSYDDEKSSNRRSREGAWIEIEDIFKLGFVTIVAPARERGLK